MPGWVKEAFDGYISKLNHDFSPQLVEIKPEKKFDSIEQKKISESEKILSHLDKEFLIVLDEKGVQFHLQLSHMVQELRNAHQESLQNQRGAYTLCALALFQAFS